MNGFDRAQLRTLVDSLRNKWKTAVVVLATTEDSNVSIISGVTKDLTAKVHAGKLVGVDRASRRRQRRRASGYGRSRRQGSFRAAESARRRLHQCRGDAVRVAEEPIVRRRHRRRRSHGLACGIELKRRGVRAVLIDKGCVVNSIYHYPNNMVFFTTPELLEIGDIPMTSLNDKPVRAEALKYYRRVADHYKLDIRQYVRVENITGEDGAFVTHAVDAHGCPRQYASKKSFSPWATTMCPTC